MPFIRLLFSLTLAVVLLAQPGCGSLGPRTIPKDRLDYGDSIDKSWKQQTLLNIIKMRYMENPFFIDIGQVVGSYTIETSAGAGFQGYFDSAPSDYGNLGINGKWTDRPTITYVPLTGSRFSASLMTPIKPASLFSAIQAGWPADLVLLLSADSINGLQNEHIDANQQITANPKFMEVAKIMRDLQLSRQVAFHVRESQQDHHEMLLTTYAHPITQRNSAEVQHLKDLLQLEHNQNAYSLKYGSFATGNEEIVILSRPMLHILSALSLHVMVPESHIEEGRVLEGYSDSAPIKSAINFWIHSSKHKPSDTYSAVFYRDHWFWIDDKDIDSKRIFSLISMMFTIGQSSSDGNSPVLTIPTS
ncbi:MULTISPECIES: hypothetical protein [unclassified Lentimonas]|uniref:hypothetical protein n=1 Tax=unclassified Lentimonas TaxID=2630993 RepID=UPI00132955B5|nr:MULTISPECIES: hypothetical protein [unclassified Lentimonas]CAA6693194.1 Unannotated [Lentimonas sp. CC10]CAA6695514.1 Unannotated [Lentimonas sp. CC19]CAA7071721.1 Unannotated [Lentimonas sp. CC11]